MVRPFGDHRFVAAVAIGRNEGERLVRCLAALAGRVDRIVYVDSGSTDGSVAAARAAGAETVILDDDVPFTAARGRNAGFAVLERGPPIDFVQFVDGDCELVEGWIEAAVAFLKAHPQAAVACGRRRERSPDASPYNRLCDMEWNTPVGESTACGGDSLQRAAAFRAVGGFDPSLIAGEEPDLCLRLRRAGWTVWRLDREMTLHDAAMTRFDQWTRRAIRSGWAYAEAVDRHGEGPERFKIADLRRIWLWGAAVPAATVAAAGLGIALQVVGAVGLPAFAGAVAAIGLYPIMAARIAINRRRRFDDPWRHAALYGVFAMLAKFPQLAGVLRYRSHARRGGAARLIEYKGPAPADSGSRPSQARSS